MAAIDRAIRMIRKIEVLMWLLKMILATWKRMNEKVCTCFTTAKVYILP